MSNPAATVALRRPARIEQRPFPHAPVRVVLLIALSATIIAAFWMLSLASLHIETARLLDNLTPMQRYALDWRLQQVGFTAALDAPALLRNLITQLHIPVPDAGSVLDNLVEALAQLQTAVLT